MERNHGDGEFGDRRERECVHPAVGPTVLSGQLSQAIYYAKNIQAAAANTNTVTVQFSGAAIYADIRILEYSGLDASNPVDVAAAATGTTATSSSGAATTTNGNDLIFGANTVSTTTSGPGSGFTKRVITTPDGDIAEDRIVSAVGSYSATAPLTSAGPWVMQMVAFRGAWGAPPLSRALLRRQLLSASHTLIRSQRRTILRASMPRDCLRDFP